MKYNAPAEAIIAAGMVISFLTISSCSSDEKQTSYSPFSVIPEPVSLVQEEGEFLLSSSTALIIDTLFTTGGDVTGLFNRFLSDHYSKIQVSAPGEGDIKNVIVARHDPQVPGSEAYNLLIRRDSVIIDASGDAGLFYAFQTLMQITFPSQNEVAGVITLPCVSIGDSPQYAWRGMHLDVARHFFPKEFIFRMLDVMAMHKLNTFHWHLTDDQGWRIDIRRYPQLREISAWRDETLVGHGSETPWVYDGLRYGGCYTQDDIREVVAYAARLHINILPEIEMPGHAVAALRAYPELSCTGGPISRFNRWGVSEDVFCAGKEETFEFLTGVLEEVAELFPYEYIHIGGDECPKVRWQECDLCQKRIADNNLKDEHELQSYFIRRIETFLATKGKKIIGWDEILEGGVADNAAVMSWRGHAGGIQAANMGHDVVMTPHTFVYLDYYQSKYNEPLAIGGMLDLQKVYSIDIMPSDIDEDKRRHIIGAQANVWTEYMADEDHVFYMVFPRLAALAEALWTPRAALDFDNFTARMNEQYTRFDAMDIPYRVPYPEGFNPVNLSVEDTVIIRLSNGIPGSKIYYSLDGSDPDERSDLYEEQLVLGLREERQLKAVTVMPGGRKSSVMSGIFRKTELKEAQEPDTLIPGIRFSLFKGIFDSVRDIQGTPDTTGIIRTAGIPAGAPAENYGLLLEGFIEVPEDGIYTFYTSSDDGVALYIDDELIVDGDRMHHGIVNEGPVAMKSGLHRISIRYFQRLYRQSLNISWEGPGIALETVPATVLFN
jgi:hexosaminidase